MHAAFVRAAIAVVIQHDLAGVLRMIQEKRLIDQTYMDSCPGDPLGVQGPDPESRIHALLQQLLRIKSLRQALRRGPARLLVEFQGIQDII